MTTRRLRPALGLPGIVVLCLSGVAPAQSLFVIGPQLFHKVGTGAVDSFLIAALLAVPMAAVYAELGSHFPDAGGEYAIIRRVLGARAGRGALTLLVITQALIVALVSLAVAAAVVPTSTGLRRSILAAAVLCGAGVCAAGGIRGNFRFAGLLLLLEIALLVLICIVAADQDMHRSLGEIIFSPTTLHAGRLISTEPSAILAVVPTALLLLNGFGSAVYYSEETRDASPRHSSWRVDRSIVASAVFLTLMVTILAEGLPMLAVSRTSASLAPLLVDPDAFTAVLRATSSPSLDRLLSLVIAALMFRALVAIVLVTARLVYASGRDAFWPAPINAIVGGLPHGNPTPAAASVAVALFGVVFCLVNEKLLAELAGSALLPVQTLIALSALVHRKREPRVLGGIRMPLFPLLPIVAMLVIGAVVLIGLRGSKTNLFVAAVPVIVLTTSWLLPVGRDAPGRQDDQRSLIQDHQEETMGKTTTDGA